MTALVERSRLGAAKQAVAGHPVGAFLLMLYPISWIFFLPAVLGASGLGIIPVDIPVQGSLLLLTLFGLTGIAFLVTRLSDGKAGTRALRRHYYRFRAAPQWYLGAVFGPPLVLLVAGLAVNGTSALAPIGANIAQIPTTYLLNVALIAVLISVWEDGAWMGFMTARLQTRFGPVWASVLVAPCFGFIHFPLFFVNGGLMDSGRPQGGGQIIEYAFYLLILFSVPVRIIVTWMFNSTGGSLPIAALFHVSMDTTAGSAVLGTFYPAVDGRLLYVGFAILAVALLVITRGRLGYRADQPPQPGLSALAVTMAAPAGKKLT
jgi:uncharacterized protein